MFWAGGMRVAWEEAASHGIYDYFFLVNDDTYLFPDALARLLKADEECLSIYGKKGVYVGTTIDPNTRVRSYGGLTTDGRVNTEVFPSNDTLLECDLTNANILLVSRPVYDCIGGLSDKYTHGIADYDYSLRAKRNGFPVLIGKGYYGECVRDHGPRWCNPDVPLRKRIKYLYSPKGLAYKETLCYMKEYFPKRYLYTIVNYWAKTLFPSLWKKKTKAYNEH